MARFAVFRQSSFSMVPTFVRLLKPGECKIKDHLGAIILAAALAVCGSPSAEGWSKVLKLAKSFGVAVSLSDPHRGRSFRETGADERLHGGCDQRRSRRAVFNWSAVIICLWLVPCPHSDMRSF
jgi:hypothetical protein